MMERRIQMRQLTQIIVLIVLGIFWGASNEAMAANEQRCTGLGANCICSEPMNTGTWTAILSQDFWNPSDTTSSDKQCNTSGVAVGAFYEHGTGFNLQTANSGEAITHLPSGHTNTWIVRQLDGQGAQFFATKFASGTPTARRSIRFYKYYSTNYGWVGGACLNGNKLAQLGDNGAGTTGPIFTETAGEFSMYAVEVSTHYNQNANGCCSGPGPGNSASPPSLTGLRGKWVRYEFIIHNAATTGAATTFEAYMKNVTDDTPEVKIIDSSIADTMGDGIHWTTALATTLHPTNTLTDMAIDGFRNGTCSGWAGFSHFLAAAWSTDAGQRVGAAVEIEGGGGDGTPPAAPKGLTVSMLTEEEQ